MAQANHDQLRKTMEQTVDTFLKSYTDASAHNDASFISGVVAPDCIRNFGPSSFLNALGAPAEFTFSTADYEAQFAKEMAVVAITGVDIANVCIDVTGRKAAATAIYRAEMSDGETCIMEFAWFLSLTEDGTKVNKILEFVDSLECPKYQAKIESLLSKSGLAS